MEKDKSEIVQLQVPIESIKTEIDSEDDDDSDPFIKNIEIRNNICNGIRDNTIGHNSEDMIIIKTENDPDASSSSEDCSYVHDGIVAVEIKVEDDISDDERSKSSYAFSNASVFEKQLQLNGYVSTYNGLKRHERYYSDEDDDDDDDDDDEDEDEDDDYECDNNRDNRDPKFIIDDNYDGDCSSDSRCSFQYSSVNDVDIMKFLMNHSDRNKNDGLVDISRQHDIDTLPSNGMADKQDVLAYLYSTINVPIGRIVRFLVGRYNLSISEADTIRKLRRRIKNRMYAKNCRIRKLRHMRNLASELMYLREKKQTLKKERERLLLMKSEIRSKFNAFYAHIVKVAGESDEELKKFNEEHNVSKYQTDILDDTRKNKSIYQSDIEEEEAIPVIIMDEDDGMSSSEKAIGESDEEFQKFNEEGEVSNKYQNDILDDARKNKSKYQSDVDDELIPVVIMDEDDEMSSCEGVIPVVIMDDDETMSSICNEPQIEIMPSAENLIKPVKDSVNCLSSSMAELDQENSAVESSLNKKPLSSSSIKRSDMERVKIKTEIMDTNEINKLTKFNLLQYSRKCVNNQDEVSNIHKDAYKDAIDENSCNVSISNSESMEEFEKLKDVEFSSDSDDNSASETSSNDIFSRGHLPGIKIADIQKLKRVQESAFKCRLREDENGISSIRMVDIKKLRKSMDCSEDTLPVNGIGELQRLKLVQEKSDLIAEKKRIEDKYLELYKHTFQSLGIENGAALLQMYMTYCLQLLNIPPVDFLGLSKLNKK